jgi:hypothetical protein
MTTKNRWQSFDGTEPLLVWTLAVPLPSSPERRACVDELLAAGAKSGVLVAAAHAVQTSTTGELLPFEQAAYAALAVPFSSRVFVRDAMGVVVERTSGDAGALLASLEPLEPAYARRFAASRPFTAAWTTSTTNALAISIAFYTSLWLPHSDDELAQRNGPARIGGIGPLWASGPARRPARSPAEAH